MHAPLVGGGQQSSIWGILGTALVAVAGIMCHVGACLYENNAYPAFIREIDALPSV